MPSDQTTVIHAVIHVTNGETLSRGPKRPCIAFCGEKPIIDIITKKCPILILTTFLDHLDVAKLCKVNRTWRQTNKGCSSSLLVFALIMQGLTLTHYNRLIEHNKRFNLNIFPCERACVFDMETCMINEVCFPTISFSEEMITNLPNLQVLVNTPLTKEEDIVFFEKITNLKALSLRCGPNVDHINISALTKLNKLECLVFDGSSVEDSHLASLSSLTSVRKLDIYCSYKITDIGTKFLTHLVNLEELKICCKNIENIDFLSFLTNLKCLTLNSPKILGPSLSPINTLNKLQSLEFYYFHLPNFSLDFLSLTSLKYVKCRYGALYTFHKDVYKIFNVHIYYDEGWWELKKKGITDWGWLDTRL